MMNRNQELDRIKALLGKDVSFSMEVDLGHIDDAFDALYENGKVYNLMQETEIPIDEDNVITLDGPAVILTEYGLEARSGVMLTRNDDGEFEPDWGLTLIHKTGQPLDEGFYYEQDGIAVSVSNYLHCTTGTVASHLENTPCMVAA